METASIKDLKFPIDLYSGRFDDSEGVYTYMYRNDPHITVKTLNDLSNIKSGFYIDAETLHTVVIDENKEVHIFIDIVADRLIYELYEIGHQPLSVVVGIIEL